MERPTSGQTSVTRSHLYKQTMFSYENVNCCIISSKHSCKYQSLGLFAHKLTIVHIYSTIINS